MGLRFAGGGGSKVLLLDLFESPLSIARSLFFIEAILAYPYGANAIEL